MAAADPAEAAPGKVRGEGRCRLGQTGSGLHRHKVFAGLAARGKTSMGWFFGFKLHLVVNECGELLAFYVTPGNVDDRQPVPRLAKRLFGKLLGDKGYLSQPLVDQLLLQDVHLITGLRKNMKNRLLLLFDKLMLRKRALIERLPTN
jgi:transposase